MKILYLSHTDVRSDSRILKSMQAAANAGHEVVAIGVAANEGTINTASSIADFVKTITLVTRRWRFLPKYLRHVFNLIELTAKMFTLARSCQAQVIHCNDTVVLPLSVLVKLFSNKIYLIYDAHELESDRNGLPRALGILTFVCEKILWRHIDSLITVSPSIERWYLSKFAAKPSTIILNSPVYIANKIKDINYLRNKYQIPDHHQIFLYIGIIAGGRGIELLLNVFSSQNLNASIVFLGYGDYSDRVLKASAHHNNIHYHPSVAHEQVVSIATSANFGFCLIENVSLSDYYSLPNKLFEYLFAGLPVIASDFPDIKNLIVSCNAGLCTELNEHSILTIIKSIVDHKYQFKVDMQKVATYGWSAQEEKLQHLYNQVVII